MTETVKKAVSVVACLFIPLLAILAMTLPQLAGNTISGVFYVIVYLIKAIVYLVLFTFIIPLTAVTVFYVKRTLNIANISKSTEVWDKICAVFSGMAMQALFIKTFLSMKDILGHDEDFMPMVFVCSLILAIVMVTIASAWSGGYELMKKKPTEESIIAHKGDVIKSSLAAGFFFLVIISALSWLNTIT